MIRLAICDDHRMVTEALGDLLGGVEDIACSGTAASGEQALLLLGRIEVDVLISDLDMPGMDGFELAAQAKRRYPALRILILSMHEEAALVKRAMEAGADGYVLKSAGKEELVRAIREVHAGRSFFGGSVAEVLLGKTVVKEGGAALLSELTEREVEVLAALSEGLDNKEIGKRLFISPRTVDTHRTNLMRKLDTHNVAGLVRLAIKAGLVR
ncbi:MAG: response regulator transcription factor [Flavobacteriales bacterium]|jgi:DNA-binding NarL/FixJ family response regulator|nr:MAG: response regulator transcription factor [Flavobacteriales bacterium]